MVVSSGGMEGASSRCLRFLWTYVTLLLYCPKVDSDLEFVLFCGVQVTSNVTVRVARHFDNDSDYRETVKSFLDEGGVLASLGTIQTRAGIEKFSSCFLLKGGEGTLNKKLKMNHVFHLGTGLKFLLLGKKHN